MQKPVKLIIGVNPGRVGVMTPPDFGTWGCEVSMKYPIVQCPGIPDENTFQK